MFVSVVDSCCDLALVETRAGGGCAALAWGGVAYEVADMWRCCCYRYSAATRALTCYSNQIDRLIGTIYTIHAYLPKHLSPSIQPRFSPAFASTRFGFWGVIRLHFTRGSSRQPPPPQTPCDKRSSSSTTTTIDNPTRQHSLHPSPPPLRHCCCRRLRAIVYDLSAFGFELY
jgi:hypothetical protein